MKKLILSVIIILFGYGAAFATTNYDKCVKICDTTMSKCYSKCKNDKWCLSKCNTNRNECASRCR
jgi:hypothetical protein